MPRVGVQFEIDANGILHVLARDMKTGRQKIVEMKSAVDVDDAEVQKMVEESVEHAFDDLRARQWIEAKIRAGKRLPRPAKRWPSSRVNLRPTTKPNWTPRCTISKSARDRGSANENGDPAKFEPPYSQARRSNQAARRSAMDKAMEGCCASEG